MRESTAIVKAREAELETLVAEQVRKEEETRKLLDQLALAGQGYEAELAAREEALVVAREEASAARSLAKEEVAAVTVAVQAEFAAYKAEMDAKVQQLESQLQEKTSALAESQDRTTEQSARLVAMRAQVDKLEKAAQEREVLMKHQKDTLDSYHARGVVPGALVAEGEGGAEGGAEDGGEVGAGGFTMEGDAYAISEYAGLSRYVCLGYVCSVCSVRVNTIFAMCYRCRLSVTFPSLFMPPCHTCCGLVFSYNSTHAPPF